MKIHLDRIKEEPAAFDFREPVTILELDGTEVEAEGEVTVHVQARRFDSGITLQIEASLPEFFECSRCLERFKSTVQVTFEYFLRQGGSKGVTEDPEDEQVLYYHPDVKELDITEQVREQIIMGQPSKPLCEPECRGLCPGCGTRLGPDPCSCTARPADPRWAKLKDIL